MEENKLLIKVIDKIYRIIQRIGSRFAIAAQKLYFMKYKLEFGEREDDIYIVTFPKSGTTLTQMLLYQMTTNGEITFKHIYEVSPWLSNDAIKKLPIRQLKSPRLIKTHDKYNEFDKEIKGKFIYVHRNGMDVAVSMYNQTKNYGHPDLKFEDFLKNFLESDIYNWFTFTKDWFENKNKLPILYLSYEELVDNIEVCIDKISKFCNINVDPKDIPRIKERCSFSFMKEHEDKFGEQPVERPPFIYDQFIRKGEKGEGIKHFNEEQIKQFKELEKTHLESVNKRIGHY